MPQNAMSVTATVNLSGQQTPALVDGGKRQVITRSTSSSLNITAATVVKASAGTIANVVVVVAGSAAGSVNDAATTGAAAAANKIFSVPNTAGVYVLDFPFANGLVITPGTGQTLAVSFS